MREQTSGGLGDPGVDKAGSDRGDSCDLVFRGGRIYTVNPQRPWVEAVAIGGGRFLRVGGNGDVEGLIGEGTEVVDLEGRLVIPAIYDTHLHLVTSVHYARSHCRLPDPTSNPGVDDYLSAIEKAHREGGGIEDGWFLGGVWSPFPFAMDAGTCLSIGSDWPCVTASCNPFPGLAMVSSRVDPVYPERGIFNERERLSIEELIPALTINGARLMNLDESAGSIEVDKSADLVVLDRNILECPPEELPQTRALLTLLEGSPVYHAEDSPMLRSAEGLRTTDMWR